MRQATLVWTTWQALLGHFAWAFTRPGYRRFVEWVTALALNVEEHTITQSVTAIERMADWKAMESFAEYGAWDGKQTAQHSPSTNQLAPADDLTHRNNLPKLRNDAAPTRWSQEGWLKPASGST